MQIGAILILKLEFLCNSIKHAFWYTMNGHVQKNLIFWRQSYSSQKYFSQNFCFAQNYSGTCGKRTRYVFHGARSYIVLVLHHC